MSLKLVLSISIMLLVVSCVPNAPGLPPPPTRLPTVTPLPTGTPLPTITPTSTPTPTRTPTPLPQARLLEDTFLYAGPDNSRDNLLLLKADSVIFPLATFGDFVKAQVTVDTGMQTGFIGKLLLDSVPGDLGALDVNEVPWKSVDLLGYFALNPDKAHPPTLRDNTIVVDSNCRDNSWNMNSAFRLTFQIETSDTQLGYLMLKNKEANKSGPGWQGIRRLDFNTRGGMLDVGITDGITETSRTGFPLVTNGQTIPDNQTITVTFLEPFGKVFVISDQNGQEIRRVDVTQLTDVKLPDGLFPNGKVIIGCGVVAGATLKLSSLSLELAPIGIWNDFYPTLKQLAEPRGITIGTDATGWDMDDPNFMIMMSGIYDTVNLSEGSSPILRDILFNTYDTVTLFPTSATSFWSGIGQYDFVRLDSFVDLAIRNHFRVRVSPLVRGKYSGIPNWLKDSNNTRDEYIQILEENIKTMVGHYKGKVAEWSIFVDDQSPPMSRFYNPPGDFWADKIGPDYIEMAFRWAKEADPNAILIFNADNNESPRDEGTQSRIDNMIASIKDLKSKGVPIDVLGMQMHLLVPWNSQILPEKADVIQTMRRFADLGVDIYITEFDVNLQNIPGTQEERWDLEARVYRDMIEACLESGVCKSFSTWGVSDADSWETCPIWFCLNLPNADPLMFDKNFRPKPAYYAVRDALAGVP